MHGETKNLVIQINFLGINIMIPQQKLMTQNQDSRIMNQNLEVTLSPLACGPMGLIAMSLNPMSAAGAIRSQPCWVCLEVDLETYGVFLGPFLFN